MRMLTGCELIAFSPDAHEAGTAATETKRRVKCQELSLTQAEVYQSGGDGLSPEAKLRGFRENRFPDRGARRE